MHRSKAIEAEIANTDLIQLVTFKVGDATLGINIDDVQEINRNDEIMAIPDAPSIFHGVVNLRGDVVTVLDPHEIFAIERPEASANRRNLILNIHGERVGVLVDQVLDILEINKHDVARKPSNVNSIDRKYIEGVYLCDSNLIVIVNAHALTTNVDAEAEPTAA